LGDGNLPSHRRRARRSRPYADRRPAGERPSADAFAARMEAFGARLDMFAEHQDQHAARQDAFALRFDQPIELLDSRFDRISAQDALGRGRALRGGRCSAFFPLWACRALAASAIFLMSSPDALEMASRMAWISSTIKSVGMGQSFRSSSGVQSWAAR